jgi:hypothetical protein
MFICWGAVMGMRVGSKRVGGLWPARALPIRELRESIPLSMHCLRVLSYWLVSPHMLFIFCHLRESAAVCGVSSVVPASDSPSSLF